MRLPANSPIKEMNRTLVFACVALSSAFWLGAATASAAEIKVLCANPVQEGLTLSV